MWMAWIPGTLGERWNRRGGLQISAAGSDRAEQRWGRACLANQGACETAVTRNCAPCHRFRTAVTRHCGDSTSPVVSFKISLLHARRAFEIEHAGNGVRDAVERSLAQPFPFEPIVFDERHDRCLIGELMVDEIDLAPRAISPALAAAGRIRIGLAHEHSMRPRRAKRSFRYRNSRAGQARPYCRLIDSRSGSSDGRTSRPNRHKR